MKTAAMVRIHKSKELLSLWLKYYSRYFDHLVVFSCASEGEGGDNFDELKDKYNFELVKVSDDIYTMAAHEKVFSKQRELLLENAWVLYSDADELVVADPYKYDGLKHYMNVCIEDQPLCMGYDVVQWEGEPPIDYTKPYLQQRNYWVRDETKSYNKPLLSRVATRWAEGFHYIADKPLPTPEIMGNTGLYLLHLKLADVDGKYDFSKGTTGTRQGIGDIKDRAELIPEKFRNII